MPPRGPTTNPVSQDSLRHWPAGPVPCNSHSHCSVFGSPAGHPLLAGPLCRSRDSSLREAYLAAGPTLSSGTYCLLYFAGVSVCLTLGTWEEGSPWGDLLGERFPIKTLWLGSLHQPYVATGDSPFTPATYIPPAVFDLTWRISPPPKEGSPPPQAISSRAG